jgi:hypothetical protein
MIQSLSGMACFSLSLYQKGKNKSHMSDTGVWLD